MPPLDFPAPATGGQTYTGPGGVVWSYDGAKWVNGASAATVVSSFNTRTGAVTLASGDVTTALTYTPYNSTNPSGYQTAAQVQAAVAPAFNGTGRNLIHNPLFNVAQRGAGGWSTSGAYTADRWSINFTGGTLNATIVAAVDARRTEIGDESVKQFLSLGVAGGATAGNFALVAQPIEDVRRLAGKTVTVSFWAAADATRTLGIDLAQVFGTGGSPSATIGSIGAQSFAITTTFARYSATITLPSIAGKTLGTNGDERTVLRIWLSQGTGGSIPGLLTQTGTISIWGVQLEIGSVATPLEKPDPRYDLSNCQRFYQVGFGYCVSNIGAGGFFGCTVTFPVTMRGASFPTVAFTGTAYTNASGIVVGGGGLSSSFGIAAQATTAGACGFTTTWTASADL